MCCALSRQESDGTVKAVVLDGFGGPDVMRVAEVDDPSPAPEEVLIEVEASAVNRADTSQRRGTYPPPPGAPEYPGLECAGTIVQVGAQVTSWSVGDEVCALLGGGGYAELVAVHHSHLLPRPSGFPLPDSACLPETACTVVANLAGLNGLRPGESLLIHGGSSGIGTTAIQWAKTLGCTVLVTVGSERKAQACLTLGADVAINYHASDFVSAVRDFTAGRGVDVVLDIVGANYVRRNLESLAPAGRLHQVGLQSGSVFEADLRSIMSKRLLMTGSTLRGRSVEQKAEVVQTVLRTLWPHYNSGVMHAVIDSRFPLTQVAAAHRHLESSAHVGKVLLNVRKR
ncbi:NAD(P)H-quinone oxidoreductase [uncultured Serinicoccus sp.]|uniref:NAD(P)H-quinone oxidoreductase n=1 Tax=uncultured Serinicoccus sp. TaxID=735514 RepID=UPI003458A0FA